MRRVLSSHLTRSYGAARSRLRPRRPAPAWHLGADSAAVLLLEARRCVVQKLLITRQANGAQITSELIRGIGVQGLIRGSVSDSVELRYQQPSIEVERAYTVGEVVLVPEERDRLVAAGPTDETLRCVARIYVMAELAGDPPAKFVKENLDIPMSTANSWIRRAKDRGTLDDAGLSARSIADHLGHAQPSMTQDACMGRRAANCKRTAASAGHHRSLRDGRRPAGWAYLAAGLGERRVEAFALFNDFYQPRILAGLPLGMVRTGASFKLTRGVAAAVSACCRSSRSGRCRRNRAPDAKRESVLVVWHNVVNNRPGGTVSIGERWRGSRSAGAALADPRCPLPPIPRW
jgi:hypothetical protein